MRLPLRNLFTDRPAAPFRLVACCLAALVALGIGANAVVELARLETRGETATATVLSSPPPLSRVQTSFTARFTTRAGEQITTEISRYDVEPVKGEQVEIVYDPREPTLAKTADAWATPWLPGIAFSALAVLLVYFGLRRQRLAATR